MRVGLICIMITLCVSTILLTSLLLRGVSTSNTQMAFAEITPAYFVYLPNIVRNFPPIPTQAPSPTQVPSTVHISDNYTVYREGDQGEYTSVVGEVFNNTSNNVFLVKVTIKFLGSNGQVLDSDYEYIPLSTISARDRTCFAVSTITAVPWTSITTEVSYHAGGTPSPNLTPVSTGGAYSTWYQYYSVYGMLRNDQGARVRSAKAIATIYNQTGKVAGCGYDYTESYEMYPGQESHFDMRIYLPDGQYTHRLQVDGWVD